MDDQNAGAERDARELECRPAAQADVVALCVELNRRGARYVVVGGFAIIGAKPLFGFDAFPTPCPTKT